MLTVLHDPRTLLAIGLATALAYARTTQEQPYREREVLDPESDTWVTAPPAAETADATFADVRRLLAEGKPGRARKLLTGWLKEVPDESLHYAAVFLLGETYFESGDFWKAYEQYLVVAENTAGDLFHDANRRCIDVARAFLSGKKRIVWKILRLPAYEEGIEILDRVWERAPGTRLGEIALKLKADYYFENGDLDLAQDEYANLAEQYPAGRYVQFAMLRTAVAAEAAFPGIRFDDMPLVEAGERYRQVLAAFPTYAERQHVPERLAGMRELRAEKDLDIARWYQRTGKRDAAVYYYRLVLRDWPDTLAAAEAKAHLLAAGQADGEGVAKEGQP